MLNTNEDTDMHITQTDGII